MNADGSYLWEDYVGLRIKDPTIRLLNLETAVTRSVRAPEIPRKGIIYHMDTRNLGVLQACIREKHGGDNEIPTVCSFANNYSLDFGRKGFEY
jgi:Bacterial capsule synthesis protein PGA_cap